MAELHFGNGGNSDEGEHNSIAAMLPARGRSGVTPRNELGLAQFHVLQSNVGVDKLPTAHCKVCMGRVLPPARRGGLIARGAPIADEFTQQALGSDVITEFPMKSARGSRT